MKANFFPYQLQFQKPSGTSRGILTHKKIWIIKLWNEENPHIVGLGECNPLVGLSIDDRPDFEEKLREFCKAVNSAGATTAELEGTILNFPSIRFAFESALKDLETGGKRILFDNPFSRGEQGIRINGLVWMDDAQSMKKSIAQKITQGYTCIKLKIGAIDFEQELALIKEIRRNFSASEIEIRVDANGAFTAKEVASKLDKLAALKLHSIEQPIRQGQATVMAKLCKNTPLPIALDEELIMHTSRTEKAQLLQFIQPQYIILKPSLIGGWKASQEWINIAEQQNTGWWITSALESNIGLNAIAQWTYELKSTMPQGLGTGQLYTNNFESPMEIKGEQLIFNANKKWHIAL